jgi:PKD repeat protein
VPTLARHTASVGAVVTALAVGSTTVVVASVAAGHQAHAGHIVPAAEPPPVGSPPNAVLTVPDRVYAGIPFTVRGDRSKAGDVAISEWEWDLDDDGVFEQSSTSTPWASTTVPAGRATVRLRVRSQNGLVATTSGRIRAVAPPASAALAALPPTDVEADSDGTTIEVTWLEPTLRAPVTYRVENLDDPGADPQYVLPADGLATEFPDLAPGTYRVAVSGVSTNGPGTEVTAETTVRARGEAEPSPDPTPTASTDDPDDTASSGAGPTEAASATGSDDAMSDRRTGALVLVATGSALIAAAVVGAVLARRRRRAGNAADPGTAEAAAPAANPDTPPTTPA